METHYHSQFDNDEFYDEAVYRFHHELYGLLLLELDAQAVVPLNFDLREAAKSLDVITARKREPGDELFWASEKEHKGLSDEGYDRITG